MKPELRPGDATRKAGRVLRLASTSSAMRRSAIELMGAAQGVDFRKPLRTSAKLQLAMAELRRRVKFLDRDRFLAPDLAATKDLIQAGWFRRFLGFAVEPWQGPRG